MATDVSTSEEFGIVLLSLFMFGIGGALDFLGILLWLRKVPPNRYVGIKLETMGGNIDIWYEVNHYVGKLLTIEGLFLVTLSLIYFITPITFSFLARVLLFGFLFLISLAAVVFLSLTKARAFSSPLGYSHFDDQL